MRAALVIVNYNTMADLRKCLESAREMPGEVETLVVDNGSTDGSREMVKGEFPSRLIDNPGNPGYSSACNRGIAATERPYVLSSTATWSSWMTGSNRLDHMDADPGIGALGPMVLKQRRQRADVLRLFPRCSRTWSTAFWARPGRTTP